MSGLTGVLSLAILDSLNPSAVLVTLYLLLRAKPYALRTLTYIAAVFVTYLMVGVVLVAGLAPVMGLVGAVTRSEAWHVMYGVLGVLLVIYSYFPPGGKSAPTTQREPRSMSYRSIAALGVLITIVEFGTALPYLGAIGILSAQDWPVWRWLLVLILYNMIMVLPLLGLLTCYALLGEQLRGRLEQLWQLVRERAREWWLWAVGAVGGVLILNSVVHFWVGR